MKKRKFKKPEELVKESEGKSVNIIHEKRLTFGQKVSDYISGNKHAQPNRGRTPEAEPRALFSVYHHTQPPFPSRRYRNLTILP